MSGIKTWKPSPSLGMGLVCGKNTEICLTEFRDKYLVIITDCGKMGSMIQVDYKTSELPSPENVTYDAKVIFGRDEPEIQATALTLAEAFFEKTVIFGLSLKEYNQNSVKELKALVSRTLKVNGTGENVLT